MSGDRPIECEHLLKEAHEAIAGGDPTAALRLVLTVLHATGGQAAAAPALNRVLTHLTADNQGNALQELSDLFARASVSNHAQHLPAAAQQRAFAASPASPAAASGPGPAPGPTGSDDSMSWSGESRPSPSPSASPSASTAAAGAAAAESTAASAAAAPVWGSAHAAARADALGLARPQQGPPAGPGPGLDPWGLGGGAGGWAGGGEQEASSAWTGPAGPQRHAPILCDTGREAFLECALADGSSFTCARCGGVVLAARAAQHAAFWCQREAAGGE